MTTPGVVRAGALSMVALAALGTTRLVHGSLVSHATDRVTYGLVGALLATTMIASLLLPGGVSSAASKFIAFHRGASDLAAARAAHRFLSRLGAVGAVVLGIGSAAAASALFSVAVTDVVAVGLLTAAYSLYTVDKSALYGFGRVSPYARLELATSGLALTLTVLVVAAHWRAYLLPLVVGYTMFVLGARLILRRDLRPAEDDPDRDRGGHRFDRREALGYAAVASVGTLAGTGFLQGTQLLAASLAAPAEVGLVAAAVVLVSPLYFLPRALSIALFPAMAVAHGAGDAQSVRTQADLSTRGLLVLLAPVFAVAVALAPEVLTVFGGAEYADGSGVLRLLLAAAFFGVTAVPSINALASGERRRARIPALSAVTGCVVGLASVLALTGWGGLGATGVGGGYLVGSALTAMIPIVIVWRSYAMAWGAPFARSAGLVVVAVPVATSLDVWGGPRSVLAHTTAAGVLLALGVAFAWPQARALIGLSRAGAASPAPISGRASVSSPASATASGQP